MRPPLYPHPCRIPVLLGVVLVTFSAQAELVGKVVGVMGRGFDHT